MSDECREPPVPEGPLCADAGVTSLSGGEGADAARSVPLMLDPCMVTCDGNDACVTMCDGNTW